MRKSIFKSKTLWGFGLAGIIALSQVFGIGASETLVAELAKVLTLLFGAYGIRDAVDK